MTLSHQDISLEEARKETQAYIEAWKDRLRARLQDKKLKHA